MSFVDSWIWKGLCGTFRIVSRIVCGKRKKKEKINSFLVLLIVLFSLRNGGGGERLVRILFCFDRWVNGNDVSIQRVGSGSSH